MKFCYLLNSLIFGVVCFVFVSCSDQLDQNLSDQDHVYDQSSSDLSSIADDYYQLALTKIQGRKNQYQFSVCFTALGTSFDSNESCVSAFRDSNGEPLVIPGYVIKNNLVDSKDLYEFQGSGVAKSIVTISSFTAAGVLVLHRVLNSRLPGIVASLAGVALVIGGLVLFVPSDTLADFGISFDFEALISEVLGLLSTGLQKGKEVAEETFKFIDNPYAYGKIGSSSFKPSVWGLAQSSVYYHWTDIISDDNSLDAESDFSLSTARVPDVVPQLAQFLTKIGWAQQSGVAKHCLPFYSNSTGSVYSGCLPLKEKWRTGFSFYYSIPKLDGHDELEIYGR